MYDLIIVGGSAAAASAGIYAIRRGLKTLIVAKDLGGEVALSGDVANWLGVKQTTGVELSLQFSEHLKSYEPDLKEGFLVTAVSQRSDGMWTVTLDDGSTADGKAVLIATGAHSRELGVPGEKEYRLKGVSYCTVCDGPLFKGKPTAVIGGGNSALEAALMLADLCPTVTLINKNPAFKGEETLIGKLTTKPNITVVYEAMTTEILGDGKVATGLKYTDTAGAEHTVQAQGMFVHIGQTPNSKMIPDHCGKDPFGYLKIGLDGATDCPGLFAAGDVTHTAHKQIIIAAGQGATAALSAVQYINRLA
jgi:alkyl hydroperoxide reductase subunit AhpF